MKTTTAMAGRLKEAGFSLAEAVIVILLFSVVSGFAVLNVGAILPSIDANAAMKQTLAQLRSGRELAIAQRRNIQLQFIGINQIQLVRQDVPNGTTVISTVTLTGKNEFLLFGSVPDTPDAFGSGAAVSFSGQAPWTFLSDGTLVDSSTNPVTGTVFLGQAGHAETARAVTILGATGRVRDYRWTGTAWVH